MILHILLPYNYAYTLHPELAGTVRMYFAD